MSSWWDHDVFPEDGHDISLNWIFINGTQRDRLYGTFERTCVYDCFFNVFTDRAIAISGGKMLVELSTFVKCTSGTSGGSISQSGGECILKKCCGNRCFSTTSSGQFVYTTLASGSRNRMYDSSVALSNSESSHSLQAVIFLSAGNIIINTLNVSFSICQWNLLILAHHVSLLHL